MDIDRTELLKLDNQLCFPIYAASRVITSLYTPYLKPLGLTYTQYIFFLVLWEKDGITVGEICKKYRINDSTVWAHVRKYSIPTRQIGNYVYIPKEEIDNLYKSDAL